MIFSFILLVFITYDRMILIYPGKHITLYDVLFKIHKDKWLNFFSISKWIPVWNFVIVVSYLLFLQWYSDKDSHQDQKDLE